MKTHHEEFDLSKNIQSTFSEIKVQITLTNAVDNLMLTLYLKNTFISGTLIRL